MLADEATPGQDKTSTDIPSSSPVPHRVTKADVESAPERPWYIINLDGIPEWMKARPRWVLWRPELRRTGKDKPPRWTKVPVAKLPPTFEASNGKVYRRNPFDFEKVDHLNPANQHPYAYLAPLIKWAQAHWKKTPWGLGYVVGDGDAMVDLDDCRDPATGEVDPWALKIVHALNSYTEISPSGTGLKIIVRAVKSDDGPHKVAIPGGGVVEVFWRDKYTATTGDRFLPDQLPADVMERQLAFDEFYASTFREAIESRAKCERAKRELAERPPATASPRAADRMDDASVIARIRESKQAGKFAALFDRGDASVFKGDASAADFALAGMLLWWCQLDTGQVKRIMLLSALVRPKWSEARHGGTWLDYTIERAIEKHDGGHFGDGSFRESDDPDRNISSEISDEDLQALFPTLTRQRELLAKLSPAAVDRPVESFVPVNTTKEDDKAAREAIRKARRAAYDNSRPECPNAYHLAMAHLGRSILAGVKVPCGCWGCPFCGPNNLSKHLQNAHARIVRETPGTKHVARTDTDPKTVERLTTYVRRHGGKYYGVVDRSAGVLTFLSTVPLLPRDDAKEMDSIAAFRVIHKAMKRLNLSAVGKKPIIYSLAWNLPGRESSGWTVLDGFSQKTKLGKIVEALESVVREETGNPEAKANWLPPFRGIRRAEIFAHPPPDVDALEWYKELARKASDRAEDRENITAEIDDDFAELCGIRLPGSSRAGP